MPKSAFQKKSFAPCPDFSIFEKVENKNLVKPSLHQKPKKMDLVHRLWLVVFDEDEGPGRTAFHLHAFCTTFFFDFLGFEKKGPRRTRLSKEWSCTTWLKDEGPGRALFVVSSKRAYPLEFNFFFGPLSFVDVEHTHSKKESSSSETCFFFQDEKSKKKIRENACK